MTSAQSMGSIDQREYGRRRSPESLRLSNTIFYAALSIIGGTYVLLIIAMLLADATFMVDETLHSVAQSPTPWQAALRENPVSTALADPKIRYSIWLSLISCTLAAVISLVVAVPMGYLLSRHQFPGKRPFDAVLDIPIVLPLGGGIEPLDSVSVPSFCMGQSYHRLSGPCGCDRSVLGRLCIRRSHDEVDLRSY
ncbi:MAG: hypothetical protein R3B91_02060 [Planctomycetaceae bacterium]